MTPQTLWHSVDMNADGALGDHSAAQIFLESALYRSFLNQHVAGRHLPVARRLVLGDCHPCGPVQHPFIRSAMSADDYEDEDGCTDIS